MSVISTSNLTLSFGAVDIFTGITVSLARDEKVGLVGPNGVGKTSLLRMIAGMAEPSSGSIARARGLRIGYLRQEAVEAFEGHDRTVFEEMLSVFAHLREQADCLQEMETRMAGGEIDASLLAEYGALQERFAHAGGYDYEDRVRRVLEGLGVPEALWATPILHLSGGQKTRALLARLLLEAPDLLILDEPTNHLDVQAVAWLERRLHDWQGTLIVASHDRYFLDAAVDRIWEMSPSRIEVYRGNYSAYVQQREERWERSQLVFEQIKERLEKELEIIRRYHAWRKFDERDGRLKRLGRELIAIERFGLLAAQDLDWSEVGVRSSKIMSLEEAHRRVRELRSPVGRPPRLHFKLPSASRSGQMVVRTHDLRVGYDGKPLATVRDVRVERGDRVAIIGPNGSGKTTLLRTILGEIPPVDGEVEQGIGVSVGYYAQAHEALDPSNSVLEELLRHRDVLPAQARSHLAQYLFRGEDVYKPVGGLSGGERSRLVLAILSLEGVNLLLLDEPTNHLDIPAQEVLQEGLEHFEGTILLVSHDRYLIDELATQIWVIHEGTIEVFKGTYREYLEAEERRARPVEQPVGVAARDERAAHSNGFDKRERKRLRRLERLEEEIAGAEQALAICQRSLEECSDAGNLPDLRRLTSELAERQARLDDLLGQWEELAEDRSA